MGKICSFLFVVVSCIGAAASAVAVSTVDQYPAKPIRLVVPTAPGGTTDVVARIAGQKLYEAWNQQVVIDNRAGAGGILGVELVAKAAPDGYTLVIGQIGTFGFAPSLYKRLPYDTIKDFAPITLYSTVPNMLAVHPGVPVKSVKELLALTKTRPGSLNYASGGPGSATHLAMEYFKLLSKADITHIPYKGTGALMTDLIAGHVSLVVTGVTPLYPHVKSGRLRPLGVATAKRIALLPDVPTIIESGVPGYESATWFGFLAPARTPKEIIGKLHAELMKSLKRPEVLERFASEGGDPVGTTPEQFGAYIKSEIERWAKVIKQAGVHID